VIAEVHSVAANRHPREDLVVVLVSAQMQMLRLLDGTEDNLLLCRKQERPVGVASGALNSMFNSTRQAPDSALCYHARGPADTRTDSHLANGEAPAGTELQGFSGKLRPCREGDDRRPSP
jgi:hypothetical protein